MTIRWFDVADAGYLLYVACRLLWPVLLPAFLLGLIVGSILP